MAARIFPRMSLQPALITLPYAQGQLRKWMAALEATSAGQSYSIGGRTLTRQDLAEVNNQIARWERTVKSLTLRQRGIVRPMSAQAAFPTPGGGSGGLIPQDLWTDWRT